MAEVRLVDVSLRDGNQSLWGATGLRTEHILQIAPLMNRVGFRALDFRHVHDPERAGYPAPATGAGTPC